MSFTALKYLVSISAILLALGLAYNTVYMQGYSKAEQKYTKIIEEHTTKQATNIASLTTLVTTLVENREAQDAALASDLETIKTRMRGKALVVYKDGTCSLTKTFLDSREAAISKANQR